MTGEPFNRRSATGITLAGLFDGWPPDCIFEIYTADLPRDEAFQWPSWRMSNADLAAFAWRGRSRTFQPHAAHVPGRGLAAARLANGPRSLLAPWLDLIPYQVPAELLARLEAFRPQVIYSMLGNIRLTRLVRYLARRLKIPAVPHFMDDWPTTYAVPGRSTATVINRMVSRHAIHQLMCQAPLGMAIGDQMASEYARRFSRPFEAFMKPVDLRPETFRAVQPNRATLGYVGGLHLSRHINLVEIALAVSRLRVEGLEVEFRIWAPPTDLAQHGANLISAGASCASLTPDEVPSALDGLDIAVHVESFQPKEAEYTRLSVSTKIPQYLAAGIPVLAYCPAEVASYRYILENGCGVGLDRADVDLVPSLRAMIEDVGLRQRMGANGRLLASRRHDAKLERERFRGNLSRAAEWGRPI